jgi:SAM-dependent methyltransferase
MVGGPSTVRFYGCAMREADPVDAARAMYDACVTDYVEFVGTELSDATEDVVDRSMLAAFVELVGSARGGAVADLGCGSGRVAGFLAQAGLDVVGIDVSTRLLAVARQAHPKVRFDEARLDELPFLNGALAGAVCWYSIIYTPPDHVDGVFAEIARVVAPTGFVLLAFQAGMGDAVVTRDAYGTGMSLTRYEHGLHQVVRRLVAAGFVVHASTVRAPALDHESGPQAFVIARRR